MAALAEETVVGAAVVETAAVEAEDVEAVAAEDAGAKWILSKERTYT